MNDNDVIGAYTTPYRRTVAYGDAWFLGQKHGYRAIICADDETVSRIAETVMTDGMMRGVQPMSYVGGDFAIRSKDDVWTLMDMPDFVIYLPYPEMVQDIVRLWDRFNRDDPATRACLTVYHAMPEKVIY